MNGITVSNFRYQVVDGAGAGNSYLGLNGCKTFWYNDEYNNASLYVLADFTAPAPVPAPGVPALLIAAFGLLGIAARRKKQKSA